MASAPHRRADDFLARVHAVFDSRRRLDEDTNFFEAGLSSAALVEILADLRDLGLDVSLVDLYRFPTVRELTAARRPASVTPGLPPWLGGAELPASRRSDR